MQPKTGPKAEDDDSEGEVRPKASSGQSQSSATHSSKTPGTRTRSPEESEGSEEGHSRSQRRSRMVASSKVDSEARERNGRRAQEERRNDRSRSEEVRGYEEPYRKMKRSGKIRRHDPADHRKIESHSARAVTRRRGHCSGHPGTLRSADRSRGTMLLKRKTSRGATAAASDRQTAKQKTESATGRAKRIVIEVGS